jgi:hypothetical protein
MRYQFSPEAGAIIWFADDGNSGVIREIDEAEWSAYQAWLDEGNVTEPFDDGMVGVTLLDASAAATGRLLLAVDAQVRSVTSQHSPGEALMWPVQLAEARAWQADNNASTPLIDSLLGDDDKAELCARIVAQAGEYFAVIGPALAWRRACADWIAGTSDVEALAAWTPQYPQIPG